MIFPPKKLNPRHRKVDKTMLARHVQENPDALLRERAAHFGISINAIWELMRAQGFVNKRAYIYRAQH